MKIKNKLHDMTKDLAREAGFVFWEPSETVLETIDWSCNYDHEVEELVKLVVRRCWRVTGDDRVLEHFGLMRRGIEL